MRTIFEHLRDAALHPHLTDKQFRRCVMLAIDYRDKAAHESIDQAFVRFVRDAIFEYERKFCARPQLGPGDKADL